MPRAKKGENINAVNKPETESKEEAKKRRAKAARDARAAKRLLDDIAKDLKKEEEAEKNKEPGLYREPGSTYEKRPFPIDRHESSINSDESRLPRGLQMIDCENGVLFQVQNMAFDQVMVRIGGMKAFLTKEQTIRLIEALERLI